MQGFRDNKLKRIIAAVLIALVCAAAFPVLNCDTADAASLNGRGKLNTAVYLRKSWSTSSPSLKRLYKNNVLTLMYEVYTSGSSTSSSSRWYAVSTGGKSGFVKVSRVNKTDGRT